MSDLPFEAQALADIGIAVFPLQVRQKKPYGRTTGLLAATADIATVCGWWAGKLPLPLKDDAEGRRPVKAGPTANIGIATGKPAGFWVLDIDGASGAASLAALVERFGPLPVTPHQRTGGGEHHCFALPDFEVRNSASKVGKDIDVRGDGGYIVAPPSVHPGDVKKGIPAGRIYTWTEGRSPFDIAFAAAPDWLLDLVKPPAPAAPVRTTPRVVERGRASRYGEAALNGACGDIRSAPPGRQNSTLYEKAVSIGTLVAGGEIEARYAEDALVDAGLGMATTKGPWTDAQVRSAVTRAFAWAENNPRTAPDRSPQHDGPIDWDGGGRAGGEARGAAPAGDEATRLWAAARPARCGAVVSWFKRIGLDPDALPGALEGLRAHAAAPIANGVRTPCLLVPLRRMPEDAVERLALFDLSRASTQPAAILGGKPADGPGVVVLTNLKPPGPVVVAIDFGDAWALATHAARKGERIRAVATLTVAAFSGRPLGDRWGRIDPAAPTIDFDHPPWRLPTRLFGDGETEVVFALRGDLHTPELRARAFGGGTRKFRLMGEDAARWLGSLAVQAWKGLEFDGGPVIATRLLRPSGADSFREQFRHSGAA